MSAARTLALWVCLSIPLSACVSQDIMLKRQAEAEAKIEHLIQSQSALEKRLTELGNRLRGEDDRSREFDLKLTGIKDSLQDMKTTVDQSVAKVESLEQKLAAPRIAMVNPEESTKGVDSGLPAEYVRAFGLYSANNFADAIKGFKEFIAAHPKHGYVSNAYYWVGESYYGQGDFPAAIEAFRKVAEGYPESPKAPDALLKLAYAQEELKEKDRSVGILENLISTYPASQAASMARKRLGKP